MAAAQRSNALGITRAPARVCFVEIAKLSKLCAESCRYAKKGKGEDVKGV